MTHDQQQLIATITTAMPCSLSSLVTGVFWGYGITITLAVPPRLEVPVVVPASEAHCLIDGSSRPLEVLMTTGSILSALPSRERPAVPVTPYVLLSGDQRLDEYGIPARVIATPGHTDGSVSVLIDDIAIIGDLMAGNLLYPNQPDYPFYIDDTADQLKIPRSLERLLDAGARVFFPGHGLPFDRNSALRWLEAELKA